jgi:hypothetical protein
MTQDRTQLMVPQLRLWPRTVPGHCDREPCHRKVVQNRTERLSMVLDALAARLTTLQQPNDICLLAQPDTLG